MGDDDLIFSLGTTSRLHEAANAASQGGMMSKDSADLLSRVLGALDSGDLSSSLVSDVEDPAMRHTMMLELKQATQNDQSLVAKYKILDKIVTSELDRFTPGQALAWLDVSAKEFRAKNTGQIEAAVQPLKLDLAVTEASIDAERAKTKHGTEALKNAVAGKTAEVDADIATRELQNTATRGVLKTEQDAAVLAAVAEASPRISQMKATTIVNTETAIALRGKTNSARSLQREKFRNWLHEKHGKWILASALVGVAVVVAVTLLLAT